MKERKCTIAEALRIFNTTRALQLPGGHYGITHDGVVYPNFPLLAADTIVSNPKDLAVNKKLIPTLQDSWSAIVQSIRYLTSPYTPFTHLDIPEYKAAVRALTFGSHLIGLFERQNTNVSIILPPTIQFSPGLTYTQKKSNGEYSFAAQVWDPPTGLDLEDLGFLLTLVRGNKKYQHHVVIRPSML